MIKELLEKTDYKLQKEGKLCLIYAKKPIEGREIVVISSHIDCVFKRCFCNDEGEMIRGTFDNSLTNAARDKDGEHRHVWALEYDCSKNRCVIYFKAPRFYNRFKPDEWETFGKID